MKKYLLILFAVLLSAFVLESCSKDDDERTYTVSLNTGNSISSSFTLDMTIFEYNEAGEKIFTQEWKSATDGSSKTFAANSNTVKVKIYFSMTLGTYTKKQWIQQVYYLSGKNTKINVTGTTILGYSEP